MDKAKYSFFVNVGHNAGRFGVWPRPTWLPQEQVTLTGRWRLHNSERVEIEVQHWRLKSQVVVKKFLFLPYESRECIQVLTKSWLKESEVRWVEEFACGEE